METMLRTQETFKLDADIVAGVAYDGQTLWASLVERGEGGASYLARVDRGSGAVRHKVRTTTIAGLTFDGTRLWGVTADGINAFDPETLAIIRTLPRPEVSGFLSGLAWDGEALWAGDYQGRRLLKIDPETGAVQRAVNSDRFVTGICWVGDELWHATSEEGDEAQLRRLDEETGAVIENHALPFVISGLDHDGQSFWCGDCNQGVVRSVTRS